MKYLVKPIRFVVALLVMVLKLVVFTFAIVLTFIWHLHFNNVPRIYVEFYTYFYEIEDGLFGPVTRVYVTFWDFVNKKVTHLK